MAASKEWKEIREKYQDARLAEFLMIQYVKLGGYKQMEKEFNAKKANFIEVIRVYKQEIYEDKPYLVNLFQDKVRYNKYEKPKDTRQNESPNFFNEYMFERYPSKIEYSLFIDLMCKLNTQHRTVNELIRLADKHGTKVFKIIKGKEKIIEG